MVFLTVKDGKTRKRRKRNRIISPTLLPNRLPLRIQTTLLVNILTNCIMGSAGLKENPNAPTMESLVMNLETAMGTK